MTGSFEGKNILLLAGHPREKVDPFRYYANFRRDEKNAATLAKRLVEQGAKVTIIAPAKNYIGEIEGVEIISKDPKGSKIESASDMLSAALELNPAAYTNVIQFACPASFRCPNPSEKKRQKSHDEDRKNLFEVVGNIDLISQLSGYFADHVVEGYDNFGNWYGSPETLELGKPEPVKEETRFASLSLPSSRIGSLSGVSVLVTAGRTVELISTDGTVITNFFEARQGIAIADSFAKRGANVTLVHGPTHLTPPQYSNLKSIGVTSVQEMYETCLANVGDIYVGCGAIADFGVKEPYEIKLRDGEAATLDLILNPNIIRAMIGKSPVVVMFAAQSPEDIMTYAKAKYEDAKPSFLVANAIGSNVAMAKDPTRNQVTIFDVDGTTDYPEMSKAELGDIIAERAAAKLERTKAIDADRVTEERKVDGLRR